VALDVKLVQLVKLFKNGEPLKMSKRSGQFVTLRDVVDEVGADVARFVMLTRKNDAPLDFDFAKALEQSKDNPVFYVQYAHARCASIFRTAAEAGIPEAAGPDGLAPLDHAEEIALARRLAEWPRLVEIAARHHEPHRVAFFLYDLASDFHALWNRGKDEPRLRFVQEADPEGTRARLALVAGVKVVIAAGLGILGVTPMDEMR
jgi:Arginyl-tRNA synthetase